MMNPSFLPIAQNKKPVKQKPRYWNEDEDRLLKEAIKIHGTEGYHKWKEVAKNVPNRTYRECMQRWTKVLAPGLKKGKWSSEEDALLRELVKEQQQTIGESNGKRIVWNKVAAGFKGRSCKQCRERWINHLDPSVKKTEWTHEEDIMLLQFYETMPNKWAKIARQIPGRTENMVKVRWNALNRQAKKRKQNALYYPGAGNTPGFRGLNPGAQNYNQFYINNQLSLNLAQNKSQGSNSTQVAVPRLSYTDEMRKNSLYLFPGNSDFPGMPMNVNMPVSFVKPQTNSDEKRKLSAILSGIPGQNGIDIRSAANILKPGNFSPEEFNGIRRNSSLVQLKNMQDPTSPERRFSFTIAGFPMEDPNNSNIHNAAVNNGDPQRRLSSFLYQDLVRNIPQQQMPGQINLPAIPTLPSGTTETGATEAKRPRIAEAEAQS